MRSPLRMKGQIDESHRFRFYPNPHGKDGRLSPPRGGADWLDAALASAERGDFERCRHAAAEARKQVEIIYAAEVQQ
ncbi:MAG: hypothetical protein LLG15_11100 [Betaproteobacteria bacterium]|nr:hypothetical protein [Betaproteobacteria bacterium]